MGEPKVSKRTNWYQRQGLILAMATMKYDIPLLDRTTRFSLWEVKMRAGVNTDGFE